ncbi:hypothetical protein [Pseudoalteromonas arctica]|uniref:Uncharacterized protein n=1 Tax=Pseudoalteromonas arctica A 37-1-2 TaxID=1117313 RepID=A0A290SE74_9GAMM|nr:hypothetical protein [Pseudoalteromonas arctica]ATC88751.1 hypothetical protein PARC_b0568 [Pseudoalteromonas arctica A 37-1-2]
MRRILLLALISICLFCNSAKAIELCANEIDIDKPLLDKPLLDKSLAKVALYADKIYGKSCLVCAEVLELDKDRIELHITSPTNKDAILNTSATIAIALPSGKILEQKLYHSCKVRTVVSGI